jgi:hypothetical protein
MCAPEQLDVMYAESFCESAGSLVPRSWSADAFAPVGLAMASPASLRIWARSLSAALTSAGAPGSRAVRNVVTLSIWALAVDGFAAAEATVPSCDTALMSRLQKSELVPPPDEGAAVVLAAELDDADEDELLLLELLHPTSTSTSPTNTAPIRLCITPLCSRLTTAGWSRAAPPYRAVGRRALESGHPGNPDA